MNKKILLFIPVYNCEKQLPRVLKKINDEWSKYIDEILIVDNISTDQTLSEAVKSSILFKNFKFNIIQNENNINLGGSHKVAFNYAKENNYDYVLVLHGDDQADINDILDLIKDNKYLEYDCLLGSRFMKNSTLINYSKLRILGNLLFNFIFGLLVSKKLEDLGSGLNIFSAKFFQNETIMKMPNDLTFNYHLILYISSKKISYNFFPISWKEEDQISNMRAIKQIFQLLKIILNFIFFKKNFFMNKKCIGKMYKYNYIYRDKK